MVAEGQQKGSGNGGGGAVKRYAVRDFFRRPDKRSFTIAPDGRHLSFLARRSGRQNIFVQGIDADGAPVGEPRALTNETERDVPGHAWKGNERILFVKDFGGDENFHVLSVPIDGGEPRDLTPFEGVKADIVDDLRDDDRHVLIQMNRRDPQVFDVNVAVRSHIVRILKDNSATNFHSEILRGAGSSVVRQNVPQPD